MSPMELEVLVHYKEADKACGEWDGVRVRKLCNLLKITQPELARIIRIPPHALQRYIDTGRFPGSIRLLINLVDRAAASKYLGSSPLKPLIPNF